MYKTLTKIISRICLIILFAFFLSACSNSSQNYSNQASTAQPSNNVNNNGQNNVEIGEQAMGYQKIDFSQFDSDYEFSARVPENWEVEYLPDIESINVYDPANDQAKNIDKSQIFIRKFSANQFLTLSTVDIFSQNPSVIKGHSAVKYDIKKKDNIADFPNQPFWRNERHSVLDVRYARTNPSNFYVISYSPDLSGDKFDQFIDSLKFYNEQESFSELVSESLKRITKKPFGIFITPSSSSVQPEKFSGYHTGVDFEVTADEINKDVPVFALCGGEILQKRLASGYGGVIIQSCLLKDEPITVVYGHISLASSSIKAGDYVAPGTKIALLGADKSAETDGERKHLHLGIKKGSVVDIRGYVNSENELSGWIDVSKLIK